MKLNITTYCSIENESAFVNGTQVYQHNDPEQSFLKGLYKHLEVNYSRFYKMDNLSKLGVLGVELLKGHHDLESFEDDAIAMVFQSEKGCLESDVDHQEKVNSQAPSPAIFVYTLANIVIGEISIRNKWFGESIFFIEKETELSTLINYSKSLILSGKSKACIVGVLESFQNVHKLKMAVITPDSESNIELNEKNLKNIFSS